jgi:hypothetical protein
MEPIIKHISTVEEMKKHIKPLYVISDYMINDESYIDFQESMYDLIKGCFEYHKLRTYPINFKFYETDTDINSLELRFFVVNLFYWYPLINLNKFKNVMDKSFIMSKSTDVVYINNWIDNLMITLSDYHVKPVTINRYISTALYNIRRINADFSEIMGLNFDLLTIFEMYCNNKTIHDLMELNIDEDMQPNEIEEILIDSEKKLINELKSIKNNPIGTILRSGTGIKSKQAVEFFISKGLMPTIDGTTIPLPIKNSTLIGGVNKASDLYIDGTGSRKSLVMAATVMGNAGHFGKMLAELARTVSLSTTVSDCGTKHRVKYFVEDEKFLEKLNNRYFSLTKNGEIELLKASKMKHLIGKEIYVRSPVTCCLENEICPTCMGYISSFNFDISSGFGAFLIKEVSKVLEQNILSTKHLLTTTSEKIEFNETFHKYFTLSSNEINISINDNDEIESIEDWVMIINKDTIEKEDDMDMEEGLNTYINNGKFAIRNIKTNQTYEISELGKKNLYLSDELVDLFRSSNIIKFSDLDESVPLFIIQIYNNELTRPLYEIMKIVNTKKKTDFVRDIDNTAQRFLQLLIESKIKAPAVSTEVILNRLLRLPDDAFNRPDFNSVKMPEYTISTSSSALEKNNSVTVGLAFQFLNRQLTTLESFSKKDSSSYLDPLFREEVSTKKIKKFMKYVNKKDRK